MEGEFQLLVSTFIAVVCIIIDETRILILINFKNYVDLAKKKRCSLLQSDLTPALKIGSYL